MGRLSALWRLAANRYMSVLLLGGLGIVLGSSVFFYVYPGKPKIGIIDIPFTIINDNSAFEIGALLSYVRQEDSIKGVVINLTSPGGSAASSEHLFFEISNLRKKKPVVMVMNDLVASGGYMMSLGTNYSYTKPSSFVGGIGVILSPLPPLISSTPVSLTQETLLTDYNAVKFSTMISGGYADKAPTSETLTRTISLTDGGSLVLHEYLWLFVKATSTFAVENGDTDDARTVVLFKLTKITEDVSTTPDSLNLTYEQIS